jgi:hypothetical protein
MSYSTPAITMTDQFDFLGEKIKASIAATSLAVLLLLPASLGFGGTIIQDAFGQTPASPPLPGGDAGGGGEVGSALTTNASTFLVRGIIGSSLPAPDVGGPSENNNSDSSSSYVLAGRFRIVANQSIVDRFIAEIDLAATDGTTTFHNVTIEDSVPFRFQLTESGNGTNTITGTSSIPPVTSNLTTRIYVDGNTPVIDNVPLIISIRGQVLAIEGIDIDETRIADTAQRDLLSIIDGQSIYGIVSR